MAAEYIVTVMSRDRVGIVADVSRALAGLGGNITDLSQTLLRGYFTLIISVETPDDVTDARVREAVAQAGAPGEFGVEVRHYEPPQAAEQVSTERFVLTTRGADRPGIIARVTAYLAEQSINIEDFYAHVVAGDLLMVLQVAVPSGLNIRQVQREIEQVGREFGLSVHLQHENIFRVTNEVRLLRIEGGKS
ncbi:MAG: ACT domain-containing protein [Armatimonadota bacterium]|nr:ACT domain-containing protein [Armatimonadota bacterium]